MMMIKILNCSHFDEGTKSEIWSFLKRFDYIPFQQFPEYPEIEGLSGRGFIAKSDKGIEGWLLVIEKKNILASIEFGPVGNDNEITASLLQEAFKYYRKKFFFVVRWMPGWDDEANLEIIRQQIQKRYLPLSNSNLIHWASKRISLKDSEETILKKFSENHRRNIKKGSGFSIECRVINDQKLIDDFSEGYIKMYKHRNLPVNPSVIKRSFTELYKFLSQFDKGFFMGAFKDEVLVGGLIIIYQGKTAFYYKGFIDHEQRQMPINHVAFFRAILHSKQHNMEWFDFGGYATDTADEQLANINKFKDGFKGELIQFPQSSAYGLNFLSKAMYAALNFKNKI